MAADTTSRIVNKLWSYCNGLRDDGLSYGDYLEQLTYLLFLKMADEQTKPPWRRLSPVPEGYDWPSLTARWDETTNHEGPWRSYDYDELVARDKCSLDLTWLRDNSLLEAENLPEPDEIAAEIEEDLQAALVQIRSILGDLEVSA